MSEHYTLRCRECNREWGNRPSSICEDCLAPLEVKYDMDAARSTFTRDNIAKRPANIWRYSELLPIPEGYKPEIPVGMTPLVAASRLGARIGSRRLYVKNDAVNFPTLSFKDRVVAVALAQAKAFGFQTVSCSSTGNLANAVAAQAARQGFDAWIFIPADLEPAKILGTQIFGARLVRIAGNYDQVNRLCSQIGERFHWGFVNINLRPYYAEGSKTVGYEIAEQLGWRLPDNVVVPMAGGSLITKIHKAFQELIALGLVESKPVRFFGAQATGCSPISERRESRHGRNRSAKAGHHRALAGHRQSGRRDVRQPHHSLERRLVRGCFRRRDSWPAWSFWPPPKESSERRPPASPSGCAKSLIAQGRIRPDEETVALRYRQWPEDHRCARRTLSRRGSHRAAPGRV